MGLDVGLSFRGLEGMGRGWQLEVEGCPDLTDKKRAHSRGLNP